MSTPLLSIERLSVSFGAGHRAVDALKNVSLSIRGGEISGIVGESGSGKSTLAMAILQLLPRPTRSATRGEIVFGGVNLTKLSDEELGLLRGKRIGFVPQEPMTALNPTVRVGRQLEYVVKRHLGKSGREAFGLMAQQLSRMRIKDPMRVLNAFPFELSGGLRQRVLLANAFLCRPDLIVADEPTTALDVTVQAEVLDILWRCANEDGAAVCFITHNMGIVWRLCDTVSVMRAGEIVEHGPARDVLANPQNDYTRRLLAALPERARWRQPILSAEAPHA